MPKEYKNLDEYYKDHPKEHEIAKKYLLKIHERVKDVKEENSILSKMPMDFVSRHAIDLALRKVIEDTKEKNVLLTVGDKDTLRYIVRQLTYAGDAQKELLELIGD